MALEDIMLGKFWTSCSLGCRLHSGALIPKRKEYWAQSPAVLVKSKSAMTAAEAGKREGAGETF